MSHTRLVVWFVVPALLGLTVSAQVPLLEQEWSGLTGHLGAGIDTTATYGFGYYSAVDTLSGEGNADTQLGWGSWLMPDNRQFTQPLCPPGTYARDHWPERGPTYSDVYQTIEGGIGQWTTTRFPSGMPKYRINSTPDCYSNQVASPAWSFYGDLLDAGKLGLAQLSNRLLVPPDGIVFRGAFGPSLIGQAWIALPLIPAHTSIQSVATGDQSWTLFLRAENFKGPVAFFTPDGWSAVNATDATGTARGHDARPAFSGSVALEIGITPMFSATDAKGVRYARIPRLTFPVDPSGRAVLIQDVRRYSKQAIWNGVAAWIAGGPAAGGFDPAGSSAVPLQSPFFSLRLGGMNVTTGSSFTAGIVPNAAGADAMGMAWSGSLERGVFPEYYVQSGGSWTPVAAEAVPQETTLAAQSFRRAERRPFPSPDITAASAWDASRRASGPFLAALGDHSALEYVWYRFVDQPAIARLALPADTLQRLQTFVESLHEVSGVDGITIPPPGSGTLATIDPALLVSPPAGLEKGYVPIVIRQIDSLRRRSVRSGTP